MITLRATANMLCTTKRGDANKDGQVLFSQPVLYHGREHRNKEIVEQRNVKASSPIKGLVWASRRNAVIGEEKEKK